MTMKEKTKYKTNFWVVSIDETKYWDSDFLKENGITKVERTYLVDINRIIYICSMVANYELQPLYMICYPFTEERQDILEYNDNIESFYVSYYNKNDIDVIIKEQEENRCKVEENFEYYNDSELTVIGEEDETYESMFENVRKECVCNIYL